MTACRGVIQIDKLFLSYGHFSSAELMQLHFGVVVVVVIGGGILGLKM